MKQKLIRAVSVVALALATMAGGVAPAAAADPGPVLSVLPEGFVFGPISVGGELGEPAEFTLSNQGTETVTLDTTSITGSNPTSFIILPNASTCYDPPATGILEAGDSCTVVVIFDPVQEGANRANLRVISDSLTSPDVLPLTGTGNPELLPGATLTPQSGAFGSRQAGTQSPPLTFNLTSSGTGDLDIGPLIFAGTNPDQFAVIANNCSNRIMASGDSCQVQVTFTPAGTGARSASFTMPTDAAGADTTVDLTGTAAAPPVVSRNSRVLVGNNLPRLRRSGSQAVPLRCFTTNMDFCRGRVTLRARGRALGLRHNRLVSIGSQAYTLRPGQWTVRVRVGNRAGQKVRRRGRLQVRVIATSRLGNGSFRTVNNGRSLRR